MSSSTSSACLLPTTHSRAARRRGRASGQRASADIWRRSGSWATRPSSGRHPADWQDLRHVPGLGQGYLGIWDRESPDEPIAVFIVSRRGESRLREELERLQPGTGASRGRHDRFGRIDGSAPIAGERRAAAVFEGEEVVGVVVAAEHGHGGEAAAYLFRPGDGVRHLDSGESLETLMTMLERDLGEVELSEWIQVPDDAPDDLGGLGPVVLALAGL